MWMSAFRDGRVTIIHLDDRERGGRWPLFLHHEGDDDATFLSLSTSTAYSLLFLAFWHHGSNRVTGEKITCVNINISSLMDRLCFCFFFSLIFLSRITISYRQVFRNGYMMYLPVRNVYELERTTNEDGFYSISYV